MPYTIISRMRGMLARPAETFREAKDDPRKDVVTYLFILFMFSTLMGMLAAAAGSGPAGQNKPLDILMLVVSVVIVPVLGIIGYVLISLWIHLWVWVFGGRQQSRRTFNALVFSSTPVLLFGWIPFISPVFSLWALILLVLGVRECQEMTLQQAMLVIFVAILPVIVLVALTFLMPETFSLMPEPSLGNGFVVIHPK
jgi:hypothetical protein